MGLSERWVWSCHTQVVCEAFHTPSRKVLACCTAMRSPVHAVSACLILAGDSKLWRCLSKCRTCCVQIEFLRPMTACILSERRAVRPFGIMGGGAALAGINLLLTEDGREVSLGGKNEVQLKGGERPRILTPGGLSPSVSCKEGRFLAVFAPSVR